MPSLTDWPGAGNGELTMTEFRAQLYNTAVAKIACALFEAGRYVAVRFSHTDNGVIWFRVSANNEEWAIYPEHHLCSFCL